jgi:uncharacterized protein (TIGR02145 family)
MNRDIISVLMKSVLLAGMVLFLFACKKDEKAAVSTVPGAYTNSASYVGTSWAVLKGQVNGKNQLTTVTFQYDTVTTYEYSISPVPDTTSRNTNVTFIATVTGLSPNTKYHFRINAVNETGIANGSDNTFSTTDTAHIKIRFNPDLVYDSIFDSEGNKYLTIGIGTQTWMAEDLKSTRFNDGSVIPFVPDGTAWASLTTPAYSWYPNDSVGYGAMYNWYAVNTGKLCPDGWHVPDDEEWTVLTDFLGGKSSAGGKLKETGDYHWQSPNSGATNESGFTGLPSGSRNYSGGFNNIGKYGYWWSTTEWSTSGAWYRDVYYGYISVDRGNASKKSGATVRCLKD